MACVAWSQQASLPDGRRCPTERQGGTRAREAALHLPAHRGCLPPHTADERRHARGVDEGMRTTPQSDAKMKYRNLASHFSADLNPHLSTTLARARAAIAEPFAQGPYCTPADADAPQRQAYPSTSKNRSRSISTATLMPIATLVVETDAVLVQARRREAAVGGGGWERRPLRARQSIRSHAPWRQTVRPPISDAQHVSHTHACRPRLDTRTRRARRTSYSREPLLSCRFSIASDTVR
jgi:hypothetical protein